MIDERYRLPETMTQWNAETVRTINKIFEHIHQNSVGIEYVTTAPTKMDYGTFSIFDDGTVQGLFYKTGKGEIMSTIPSGGIILWSGAEAAIPTGWYLCNGSNGTPDLRNRFIVGAGSTYAVAATGGTAAHTLTTNEMPAHTHSTWYAHDSGSGSESPDGGSATNRQDATTGSAGGGAAHENRPPYYALCYIMKA